MRQAAGFEGMGAVDEEEQTFVDTPGRPLPQEQQAALSRRIRHAMEQTLPLGTPTPAPTRVSSAPSSWGGERTLGAYNTYKQTILLGGRQSPFAGAAPPEPAPVSTRGESTEPGLTTPHVPWSTPSTETADGLALRGSFVRAVGLPTAPPPRRSRRPPPPGWEAVESEPPPEEEHEAFSLDRPIGTSLVAPAPSVLEPPPWKWPEPRGTAEPQARASGSANAFEATFGAPVPGSDRRSVMLPPRPGPGDFEPPSSPVTLPGAGFGTSAASLRPSEVRPPAPQPLFSSLPSVNPFAGFEAPSESFAQRSLIVFIVALAVVGLFALAAIAFGFLGKTGW